MSESQFPLQAPSKPSIAGSNGSTKTTKRIAVLGASGYTGEEVVRLLALHPSFKATALTGESQAGKVCSQTVSFWSVLLWATTSRHYLICMRTSPAQIAIADQMRNVHLGVLMRALSLQGACKGRCQIAACQQTCCRLASAVKSMWCQCLAERVGCPGCSPCSP